MKPFIIIKVIILLSGLSFYLTEKSDVSGQVVDKYIVPADTVYTTGYSILFDAPVEEVRYKKPKYFITVSSNGYSSTVEVDNEMFNFLVVGDSILYSP